MAEAVFPVSYKDPQYAALDAATEQKLGLPAGLLSSVRVNGEASNHNQTNSENTFGVYQFIPATRKAILDKYGIDVTLSPRNASEGAGLLLQEGMKRSGGDPAMAVAQYIGGTNPANWGTKTKVYVQRVMQGVADAPKAEAAAPGVLTFTPPNLDKVISQFQLSQAPGQLQALYEARTSGKMTPEDAAQYDQDVQSGRMMLPRGAVLPGGQAAGVGGAVPGASSTPLPAGVLDAFQSGRMDPKDAAELEHDVRAGVWQLPAGVTADSLFPKQAPMGVGARMVDAVTGQSRSTPEIEAMPDWTHMPSLDAFNGGSVGVGKLLKIAAGTLASNPQETAQILQANIPGLKVAQDSKGNPVFIDPADGNSYGYKPGMRLSDAPRVAGTALAFTPAGRATSVAGGALASAATQAAIEGTQAAAGGTFNTGDVALAGTIGAVVPAAGRVLSMAAQPATALVGRALGRAEPAVADSLAAVKPGGAVEAGAYRPPGSGGDPINVAPDGTATMTGAPPRPAWGAPMSGPSPSSVPVGGSASTVEGVAQTARTAAEGSKRAVQDLAAAAAPNPETAAAAERLGISSYLQPDHVTSNDAFRQVVGVLKSNPTGQLALQEKEGLAKVAERASKLIDEVGGTNDLSQLDASVKQRMQAAHTEISAREDKLYQTLREKVGPTTEAPANNALTFLEQRAKDLGGEKNLSPMEKAISAKLAPKGGANEAELDALGPAAKAQAKAQGVTGTTQPTYALLDDVRRDVGAAARARGPFSDADTGLAKKYYSLLTQDQAAVADAAGAGEIAKAARAATVVRKGMEDDLSALFGKNLDQSLVPQVGSAMKAAAGGDAAKLLAVLKATPDSMKQEVVASGMATVFRNSVTRGEMNFTGYAKWYESLQRNQQAYAAVMSNLPPAARSQLADLYRVSRGISDSLNARIKTGLRSSVLEEMKAPDSLAMRLFDLAKHAGKGLAADALGGHGAGLAMGLYSALRGGAKPNAVKAIDELLTSPEFQHLASQGSAAQPEAVRRFAYSKAFTKFARAVGNPRELSNREKWVLEALQTRNSMER